jgi:hypothetical protein
MNSTDADDSERVVLGSLLLDPDLLGRVSALLTPQDFRRRSHDLIFWAMQRAAKDGSLDSVSVASVLVKAENLDAAGGPSYLSGLLSGLPNMPEKSVLFHVRQIAKAAKRRRVQSHATQLAAVAGNGAPESDVAAQLRDLTEAAADPDAGVIYADLTGICDPSVGRTPWIIEQLIPASETTLLAAQWKTAKTLCCYALALDAIAGTPVWGRFKPVRPLRVAIYQLEMPHREDLRRLRRLALGAGIAPESVTKWASEGRLKVFNRPPWTFSKPDDLAQFHQSAAESDLVIVDSAVAAFSGIDTNDNAAVRKAITEAFSPLTSAGHSVLLLHHYRKSSQLAGRDDPRGQVLGAGQFGAAVGRIYGMERLKDEVDAAQGTFKLSLSVLGAWAPGDLEELTLGVEDTPDGHGTIVAALASTGKAESRLARMPAFQQAAHNIRGRVKRLGRVDRKSAIASAVTELRIGQRTAEDGLIHAEGMGWIRVIPGANNKAKDIIPGDVS